MAIERERAVIKHGEHYGRVNIGVFCVQERSMLKPARNNNKAMNINRMEQVIIFMKKKCKRARSHLTLCAAV